MPETPLTIECRAIAAKLPHAINMHGNMNWLRALVYEDSLKLHELYLAVAAAGAPQQVIDDAARAWVGIANSLELYGRKWSVINIQENGEGWILPACDFLAAVPPPNQPPVNTIPAPMTGPADAPFNVLGLSVADPDSANITVRLQAAPGVDALNVLPSGNITGNDTTDVVISGPLPTVNAALARVIVTPTAAFTGLAGFQMTSDDGSGGADSDPVYVTFT